MVSGLQNPLSKIVLVLAVFLGSVIPVYAQTSGASSYATIGVVVLSVLIAFGLIAARFKLISVEVEKTPETGTPAPVTEPSTSLTQRPAPQPTPEPVATKPTSTLGVSNGILTNHESELARAVESLTREREQLREEKSRLQVALQEASRHAVDQIGGYGTILQEVAKSMDQSEPVSLETARLRERYLTALVEIERLRNERRASVEELGKLRQSLAAEREELRLMREELLSVLTRFQEPPKKS
jgi:DNA repair exonuclease SbcCD ATPase subunit